MCNTAQELLRYDTTRYLDFKTRQLYVGKLLLFIFFGAPKSLILAHTS